MAYWLLILAEGAYLGARVVTKLYDWTAARYDGIKQFDPFYEQALIGEPLHAALSRVHRPRILDVAAGTGRLPRAVLGAGEFEGTIVELDRARRMLTEGRALSVAAGEPTVYAQADALHLPFPDGSFDAVVSLEAIEFFPGIEAALAEMARVLRPGGLLFITNRKGGARYYMPGRVRSSARLTAFLASLGIADPRVSRWQVNYDLVYGRKGPEAPVGE